MLFLKLFGGINIKTNSQQTLHAYTHHIPFGLITGPTDMISNVNDIEFEIEMVRMLLWYFVFGFRYMPSKQKSSSKNYIIRIISAR